MDEIIERIIKIEEEAQELIKKAREEKEHLGETIYGEVKKMQEEISARAEKKQETLKNYEDDEADKKIEKINTKLEADLRKIEDKAKKSREGWIENLVNTVVK